MWTGVVYFLFLRAWRTWQTALADSGLIGRGEALIATIFSLFFLGGEFLGLGLFAEATSFGTVVAASLLVLLNLVFYHLLKAPTRLGRRAMDAIRYVMNRWGSRSSASSAYQQTGNSIWWARSIKREVLP